ncbi:MAG: polysaccharide deacetylase family protein [Thermoplasmata archaeon]|nr:MAG: polysaccharide deacetylase family protein [Thermoplasmata archaeon]
MLYHQIGKELFREHIRFLKSNHKIISLDELYENIKANDVPAGTVVITFDDGYKSNHTEVLPVVKEFKIPVTIYLVTNVVGTTSEFWFSKLKNIRNKIKREKLSVDIPSREFFLKCSDTEKTDKINELAKKVNYKPAQREALSWGEINEMHDTGYIHFGAHTHTHPALTNIDDKQVKKELKLSKRILEKKLNNKVNHFSYPNGNYYEKHLKLIKKAGYLTATTTNAGVNTTKTNPYLLYRIGIGETNSIPVTAVKISGLWYKIRKLDFDWDNYGRKDNPVN